MASVRKTSPSDKPTRTNAPARTSPAGSAGLCLGCGTQLVQTPGKQARIYCSKSCSQKARRAALTSTGAVKPLVQQPASTSHTPKSGLLVTNVAGQRAHARPTQVGGRLGTTGETTDKQVSGGTAGAKKAKPQANESAGRDRRYILREGLSAITRDRGLKGCGRSVIAGGVSPMMLGSVAYYAGVVTCGKVHLCPCCGAKIRSARTVELQAAGAAWECQRCGLAMLTLTLRHYERHTLKQLVTWQREAWKLAFGMNAGREWRTAKGTFEIEGYVRAWECTHGEANGWHPHYHVLFFTRAPWSVRRAEDFEALAYRLWSTALGKVGAYLPNEEHGVDVVVAGRGTSDALARYLMKFQEGAAWGIAAEMTRADNKQGKAGRRTPFQIAEDFLRTGDAADLELWHQFEEGAHGIRALYWSQGLRKLLGALVELDERSDGEIAAEERNGEPLALVPSETWYRHIVRYPGRSLALLRAAENKGQQGVRLLILEWGMVWGQDVLPPPLVGGSPEVSQ